MDPRGTLALIGTVICWGIVPVFLRELTAHVDPWTANGLRYPLAALLYWPILVHARRRGRLDRRVVRRAIVPGVFALAGQIFWAISPYYLTASLIGFLVKLSIVWGLAGALILFPEERGLLRSGRFHGGLVLAVAGFLTLSIARGALEETGTLTGVLIIVTCSFFFGLYGVSVRYFLRGINPLVSFGVVAQMTSVGTITLMFAFGAPEMLFDIEPEGWALIAVSSLVGIAISHVLYYTAIHRLGASLATLGHLAGPFVTLIVAHLALSESLTPVEWFAGACIVSGGALLVLSQQALSDRPVIPARTPADRPDTSPEPASLAAPREDTRAGPGR